MGKTEGTGYLLVMQGCEMTQTELNLGERVKRVKTTQKQLILDWFKSHESLTRLESITELGIIELPARIIELERDGWHFPRETYKGVSRIGGHYASTRYYRPEKRLEAVW